METWKEIPGYEKLYEVSSRGNVRSLERTVLYPNNKSPRKFKAKLLKQSLHINGKYYGVRLSKQGKTKLWLTHQLVCLAFLGPTPKGMVICHGPLGNLINTLNNLSFGTPKQNSADQWRDGTKKYGEHCSWSKLTTEQVLEIKNSYRNGARITDLAMAFGISQSRTCDIIKGRGWNHLSNDHISRQCSSCKSMD